MRTASARTRRAACWGGLLALLLPTSAWLLGACSGLPPAGVVAPKLAVRDVSIVSFRGDELRLRVDVDAENPNPRDIPLADLKLDLELLGLHAASARALEPVVTLPASASRIVTLDVSVPARRLGELLLRAAREGDARAVPYRLTGSAAWGTDGVPLPFQRSGTIDLAERLRRSR